MLLSCCQPKRQTTQVAPEQGQQQPKKSQTKSEQDYVDQIELEEYMQKKFGGPSSSGFMFSTGVRRNYYCR
ncbi:hypothetical protein FBU30_005902 [Linnemannia zychae]|nr:hypothetical protein FBU30_005902 [Linnemannia zychae]